MTTPRSALLVLFVAVLPVSAADRILCFPSLLYGHILIGTAASRYQTTFIITGQKGGRVTLRLFSDGNEPLEASFADENGDIAATGASFEFLVPAGRRMKVRLLLPHGGEKEDVMMKTGWAMFRFSGEVDVRAHIRVTDPAGKLLSQYILHPETPAKS